MTCFCKYMALSCPTRTVFPHSKMQYHCFFPSTIPACNSTLTVDLYFGIIYMYEMYACTHTHNTHIHSPHVDIDLVMTQWNSSLIPRPHSHNVAHSDIIGGLGTMVSTTVKARSSLIAFTRWPQRRTGLHSSFVAWSTSVTSLPLNLLCLPM